LHLIGATTIDEYRKYIEKDAALERRFQPVLVEEPSLEDTIAILEYQRKYEIHHGLRISDDALVAAANLSIRYLPDRFLPDKAIDLIDEAASALKIEIDSMPQDLDLAKRKITQIEIELAAKEGKRLILPTSSATARKDLGTKQEASKIEDLWKQQKALIQEINVSRPISKKVGSSWSKPKRHSSRGGSSNKIWRATKLKPLWMSDRKIGKLLSRKIAFCS
jgi:ATP-dependent Clp protease ATP-binding subunit ClpB